MIQKSSLQFKTISYVFIKISHYFTRIIKSIVVNINHYINIYDFVEINQDKVILVVCNKNGLNQS